MRVLVVEDETRLSRQLARALGDAGYAVDCAADGERADFLVQTERYDAVVLDLGLPKIDGLTLLRRWRDARGMSQLTLATEAGISTRHLSFLETSRAQPSREIGWCHDLGRRCQRRPR